MIDSPAIPARITGKLTLLIVDDTETNIFSLERLLENDDRILLTATSGREALKIAFEKAVDLIVLDVHMPEMDGFEVAQILKSNKKTKDIPIIFATAEKKEHTSMLKGFEGGAIDYLFKPLDPEITKAKVAVLLELQLQKKELMAKNASLEKAEKQIKQLNTELEENILRLKISNKELESFSYSVSHDLQAPLRGITGFAKILEEDYISKLDKGAIDLLHNIQQNAHRMEQLINDLLRLSRLGRQDIQKNRIDMNAFVKSIIQDLTKSMSKKPEFKIQNLGIAYADSSLMTQVLINLLDNAIKYSSKKELPQIEIGCYARNGEMIYYIKDNGAGFNMEYADKLFGVFQRLHSINDFNGTGIGLAIVKRVIEKHGGSVWAEGKENEGATFNFTLPILE